MTMVSNSQIMALSLAMLIMAVEQLLHEDRHRLHERRRRHAVDLRPRVQPGLLRIPEDLALATSTSANPNKTANKTATSDGSGDKEQEMKEVQDEIDETQGEAREVRKLGVGRDLKGVVVSAVLFAQVRTIIRHTGDVTGVRGPFSNFWEQRGG